MYKFPSLYIDGQWVKAHGQGMTSVINPANGEVAGEVPAGDATDVDQAARAARKAFASWSQTSAAERSAMILRIAEILERRLPEMGAIISAELGSPIGIAIQVQSGLPLAVLRSYAEHTQEMEKEDRVGHSVVVREPVGVCGFITPWNYPLHQLVAKVAPALAAGCTIVLKPSQETPLSALLFAEVVHEAGLPAGVYNVVTGSGRVVGEAIATHPDVDMVSITGSTSAGIRVAELAAKSVKRVSQELGGKSANIVLDGGDLAGAVARSINDITFNSGQTCSALTRLLVPYSRQAEAVEIARSILANIVPGNPADENVFMGPMVSEGQRETVLGYIRKGVAEGATLAIGGVDRPAGLEKGAYVVPTVFADVRNDMTIAQEEIFGPVLCIIPCETEEEALRIANDSPFGLSGAVWAADVAKARKAASLIRTGQVAINGGAFNPFVPFGGYKQSGNGRELGAHAMHDFIELKSLHLPE